MSNPETPVSASKPMAIAGRMVSERERLLGMTDAERAWRAQWLKDQVLAPDEPVVPKGYYEERYNVIRRFYRAPLNAFEKALTVPLVWKLTIIKNKFIVKDAFHIHFQLTV